MVRQNGLVPRERATADNTWTGRADAPVRVPQLRGNKEMAVQVSVAGKEAVRMTVR